ncbi:MULTISPECIES: hypothetical protein [Paenibacillus]|uniref:hypothetical protein n=1 Tax=Paenibacillus TaxID=44249 RepID=UPI0002EDAB11|nr:hypothetical protein [Paenibacillus sp. OSY-SE]
MGAAMSLNVSTEKIEVVVRPKMKYSPAILTIRSKSGTVELHGDDEHFAEIEYALRQHLESLRYPETPDQQQILNAEHNHSLEEDIA